MNLLQLATFREVMLCGSVSQAARNLGRTQPAVSATLAALEADLGARLFERRGRRLHPAPEARYLLEEAIEILDRVRAAERNMRDLRDLATGELRIATMPGPSVVLLPSLLARFTEGRRDVHVRLVTRNSPGVVQLVATQSYDFGVMDLCASGVPDSGLVRAETFETDCVCAVAAGHPLAAAESITPADLDGAPVALLQPEHQTHLDTEALFRAAGARLNIRFETEYFISLLTFVEQGRAAALVDVLSAESYVRQRGGAAPTVAFRPFAPALRIAFATVLPAHRTLSQLAGGFLDLWRREIAEIETRWRSGGGFARPAITAG